MELSKRIKEARERLGLMQKEAAQTWGIPLPTLKAYEQNKRIPRGLAMTKLLEILSSVEAKPASASSAAAASQDGPSAPSKRSRTTKPAASEG